MKLLLRIVGGFLAFGAFWGLMVGLAFLQGGKLHDSLVADPLRYWHAFTFVLVVVGGGVGAVQLFRQRPSGRFLGVLTLANDLLHTVLPRLLRGGEFGPQVWAAVALDAALLTVLLLPAAREACASRP